MAADPICRAPCGPPTGKPAGRPGASRPAVPLLGPFKGRTHPARYRLHKYWARKPHNVVKEHIEYYTAPGDLVLDPFCGSGVSVIEAVSAGRRAVGLDLNPVAVRIVEATLSGLPRQRLVEGLDILEELAGRPIMEDMETECPLCGGSVQTRYRVWASVASCPDCGKETLLGLPSAHAGRSPSRCACGRRLGSADVFKDRLFHYAVDCRSCRTGGRLFDADGETGFGDEREGERFLVNGRIMAWEGLSLGLLYCAENWRHMHLLKSAVAGLDEELGSVYSLVLTATAAQASRMIPFRGNLASGGPAWTVPGFWVPKVHLQLNSWRSFERRARRMIAALCAPAGRPIVRRSIREVLDGLDGYCSMIGDATEIGLPDDSVDYIITDPPYGDSVPYLEFSQLWFSWLGRGADFDREIVISDSNEREKGLEEYSFLLSKAFREMARVLKPGRWLTCFFQNRSLDVWQALGRAALEAGFSVAAVAVQEPAVVSAKSQLSRSGSLTGDVVIQFRLDREGRAWNGAGTGWRDLAEAAATKRLEDCGGEDGFESLASSVLVELWRNEAMAGSGDLAALFDSLFEKLPGKRYRLRCRA